MGNAVEANILKAELIKLVKSLRLAENASQSDINEFNKLRAVYAEIERNKNSKVPGKNRSLQLANACYDVVYNLERIDGLRTEANMERIKGFCERIGLTPPTASKRFGF